MMNREHDELGKAPKTAQTTRRDLLAQTFQGCLVVTLASPLLHSEQNEVRGGTLQTFDAQDGDYVPENDYPFFGGELPYGY